MSAALQAHWHRRLGIGGSRRRTSNRADRRKRPDGGTAVEEPVARAHPAPAAPALFPSPFPNIHASPSIQDGNEIGGLTRDALGSCDRSPPICGRNVAASRAQIGIRPPVAPAPTPDDHLSTCPHGRMELAAVGRTAGLPWQRAANQQNRPEDPQGGRRLSERPRHAHIQSNLRRSPGHRRFQGLLRLPRH